MKSATEIVIRDVQDHDLPVIFAWENNTANWEVSETERPYTFDEIKDLIASATDFTETKQKRWIIALSGLKEPIGTIDIFQGELPNREVGLGILIAKAKHRGRGFGQKAVAEVINICSNKYQIHTFHVTVHQKNVASIRLFEKCGFKEERMEDVQERNEQTNLVKIKMSLCVKKS